MALTILSLILMVAACFLVDASKSASRSHHRRQTGRAHSAVEEAPANPAHWNVCKNSTMVRMKQSNLAYNIVQHMNKVGVAGDIVECGVWLGGQSCYMTLAEETQQRDVWLFDTFKGMSTPDELDGLKAKSIFQEMKRGVEKVARNRRGQVLIANGSWVRGELEDVKQTMARTQYPSHKVHYIQGKVEDVLKNPSLLPSRIAALRLDTDFYASTAAELQILWPKVSPGGWLYLDDYITWKGCQVAVTEWLKENNWVQEAHAVEAFPEENPYGVFTLLKSNPYNHLHPFQRIPF
eukprot:6214542-Pleurochrysis_carterae.AAC.1